MSVNNAEMHEIIWKLDLSSVGEICITPLFPLIRIAALKSNSSESLRNAYLRTLKMAVLGEGLKERGLIQPRLRGSSAPPSKMPFQVVWGGGVAKRRVRGVNMSWVTVVGGYNSVGTKLFFNMEAKISGAISIVFSEVLSPRNKGEFDPLLILQQQDVHMHTQVFIQVYVHMHTERVPARL